MLEQMPSEIIANITRLLSPAKLKRNGDVLANVILFLEEGHFGQFVDHET